MQSVSKELLAQDTTDLLGNAADLERLRATVLHLGRRIRASFDDGITASQRSAMGTIFREGRMTIGRIAEREHVQPPTASKIVAGLEAMGLVERSTDPNDRRASLISLTDQGREAIARMQAASLGFLAGRLAELDPADVDLLEAALPALERLLGERQ